MATRKASEAVLQELAKTVPELVGGSGDLDPSTFTWLKEDGDFESPLRPRDGVEGTVGGGWGYGGRNIHFGVREHAMGAAVNGLVYHGGFIPFGATFLVFADYMRPPIRLSAIAELRSIWVYTHDSIGVGEDGPTHEPVEQLASLRAIPGMTVLRPVRRQRDARAPGRWRSRTTTAPTVLVLSRQHVPTLDRSVLRAGRGAAPRRLRAQPATRRDPELILIGDRLRGGAHRRRRAAAARARSARAPGVDAVVGAVRARRARSIARACCRAAVKARLAVEAARSFGWERWVGIDGDVLVGRSLRRVGAGRTR